MTASAHERDPLALLDDYDFELPEDRIAQTALAERDAARMLVIDRRTGRRLAPEDDACVRDLPDWLSPGDLLVVNATRVLAARLPGRKASGGTAEALLLGPEPTAAAPGDYRALLKCTGRVRTGLELQLGRPPGLPARVTALHERGEVTLRFAADSDPYALGEAPLPPYIRRPKEAPGQADLERYQTVFAREPGAVAAPTAGLHLTDALFDRLAERGIERAEVVLHVGAGTFRPLDARALETGHLHAERYRLPVETVDAIERTRARGGRVVAVGTTSVRVLESCCDDQGRLAAGAGQTTLFIRPEGPPFRVVDALLTNFHLPRSSLLLLVARLLGREPLLAAYRHAIDAGYRFYSYGDAMLILDPRGDEAGLD